MSGIADRMAIARNCQPQQDHHNDRDADNDTAQRQGNCLRQVQNLTDRTAILVVMIIIGWQIRRRTNSV